LVDGNIAEPATAAKIVEFARGEFRSISTLVNKASICFSKPFIDYAIDDLRAFISTLR
jgi:NAD(P)-dependent dehydrogenase (short-subunit alcohol dehydrogenase family)